MKQLLYVSAASLSLIAGIAYADGEKQENRETIVVKGSRIVKYLPGALKTDIIRTEVVTAAQIEAVNATNINQAVDKNPGISVQTECSICNVRNVTLNNMPGRFTTLMIDSVPLFSSLSTSYGLDSVNVAGVKSIDISRGAGASLIAPEALSGVVNIITKRPLDKEISATLEGGDYNSNTFSVFGALPFEGGAITASALATKHDSVDDTGSGISQFTGYDRKIYGLALFLEPNGWLSKSRLDYVDEKRSGGAIGDDYAAIAASESGNPFDWTKLGASQINGWDAPDGSGFVEYADGRGGFSEIIFTKRHSVISTLEKTFDFGTLRFAGGYAHNEQESYYEKANYNAEGDQYYLETSFKKPVFDGVATIGLNYRFEDLVSVGNDANKVENNGIDNYEYKTPGAFIQFYKPFMDEKLETNFSIRYDDHNVYGEIISPRANFLYHHNDNLNSRLSMGKGFRAPTSFFEQDHGILDTSRIVREVNKVEESNNLTYALNYSSPKFVWQASYNYNLVKNMAMLDSGETDDDGNAITLFTSSTDDVTIQSLDFQASYKFAKDFALSLGLEKTDFDFAPGTLAFSRPELSLYSSIDYEKKLSDHMHLHTFARVTYIGEQDLANFYDYANTPRYNLNGTKKMDKSPSYATFDAKISLELNDNWTIYSGVDNLTDYKQSDKESLLWLDETGSIDVTHIWGPNRGRYIYAGIKINF